MSATAWTVGRYVVETLAANGIDTVFGIPGVHNIELYRGLEFARLRHVLVRHEQNAGFAADGYARVSGCAAAAFVISGPGVTNALTAVAQAYSDSVPLLVIASSPVRASLGKGWGVLHELGDQRAVAAGVAGLARSAYGAQDVRDHLRAAFATLYAARARPAYLEIPLDLLAEPTILRPERFARSGAAPPPSPAALAAAQALLAEAQRPLIIAGGGARRAGGALRKLVEAVDGYLITTVAGKGAVAESHPASLGASLPSAPTQELVAGAAAAYRARIDAQFDSDTRARLAAVRALREALPSDGVLFTDMTQIAYLGNYAFAAERPGLWFHPSGYGALGYALPAAIGAKIAQPARAVVALAGDYGVQFTLQELMTAVELDLTLPVVVWNNGSLGQIRDDMRAAGIAPIGVVARNPDFVALAGACGAAGVRVHEAAALAEALRAALARPGPTLLEAVAGDF